MSKGRFIGGWRGVQRKLDPCSGDLGFASLKIEGAESLQVEAERCASTGLPASVVANANRVKMRNMESLKIQAPKEFHAVDN